MKAEQQLDQLIDRYSPGVAEDARYALGVMARRLPTATRLVYDNYNALAIGFGPSEKASEAILSIALYPRYLTLFFLQGIGLPDPHGLLQGSGSRVRSIRLDPVLRLESREVSDLIDAAVANARRLPESGEGPLVIKSISAKQRARRPAA